MAGVPIPIKDGKLQLIGRGARMTLVVSGVTVCVYDPVCGAKLVGGGATFAGTFQMTKEGGRQARVRFGLIDEGDPAEPCTWGYFEAPGTTWQWIDCGTELPDPEDFFAIVVIEESGAYKVGIYVGHGIPGVAGGEVFTIFFENDLYAPLCEDTVVTDIWPSCTGGRFGHGGTATVHRCN